MGLLRSNKYYFIAEAADNFLVCENGKGVTFQLAGRHLATQYRVDFANRFTVLTDLKPDETPELTGKVEMIAPDIIPVQIASGNSKIDRETDMVVGVFPSFHINNKFERDVYTFKSDLLRVEIRGFPFKIAIYEKFSTKLIFESQDSIQSYVDKGWNLPVGQIIDSAKKYTKTTFFSTKLNTCEHFYGTGEMFGPLDKLGQQIYLDICDTTTTDTERHYKAIPFYMSTNHYGVFINQSTPILFDFAASSYRGVTFQTLDDFLDFYIINGPNMKVILDCYTALTGKCEELPPKWSFGLWMPRISYKSQQEVYDTIKAMRDHEVPFDVLHFDTDWFERGWECDFQFSKTRFPDPKKMIEDAHRNGVKISLRQLPYIRNTIQLYKDGEQKGYFARSPKTPI